MIERRPDGERIVVTGSSGMGKSASAIEIVGAAPRLFVWDVDRQWCRLPRMRLASSAVELVELGRQANRVAYFPPATHADSFDFFCRVAWAWGQLGAGVVVAEELAAVTQPGKAPTSWGELIRRGRKYGITVVGVTQSVQESDKTLIRNASLIRCHYLTRSVDRRYMAHELDVAETSIESLQQLEYIERRLPGRASQGRTKFPKALR